MLRILFMDNDEKSIEPARKRVESMIKEADILFSEFKDGQTVVGKLRPDLIILDLFEGVPGKSESAGQRIFDFVWKTIFCPIIIYSALPEIDTHNNPFVKLVKKGKDSDTEIELAIKALMPHIQAIKEAEDHIRYQFAIALREFAPYAFKIYPDDGAKRNDLILRSGRRRLAAFMDEQSRLGTDIASWEQYLMPPVSEHVSLGDIIRLVGGDKNEPESYRVVLTPSCDMISEGKRKPKVKHILTGRCCNPKRGIELMGFAAMGLGLEDFKNRLNIDVLSQGYCRSIVPLPSLANSIPLMMLNLRDLDLIPIGETGELEETYERIASLDSPFRELISWAYMQIACRPGLPDRNIESWLDEIIAQCQCFIKEPKK